MKEQQLFIQLLNCLNESLRYLKVPLSTSLTLFLRLPHYIS